MSEAVHDVGRKDDGDLTAPLHDEEDFFHVVGVRRDGFVAHEFVAQDGDCLGARGAVDQALECG